MNISWEYSQKVASVEDTPDLRSGSGRVEGRDRCVSEREGVVKMTAMELADAEGVGLGSVRYWCEKNRVKLVRGETGHLRYELTEKDVIAYRAWKRNKKQKGSP